MVNVEINNQSNLLIIATKFYFLSLKVVFFAWERYIIIVTPLKRFILLSVTKTKKTIFLIFIIAPLLTSYSLIISGLRPLEEHEVHHSIKHECDTLNDYRSVYDIVIILYILNGIIVPLVLVFFFNITIVRMLIVRKKMMLKKKFETSRKKCMRNKSKTSSNITTDSSVLDRVENPENFELERLSSVHQKRAMKNNLDHVSLMLILICFFFIFLNLPYIIAWLVFFIPFKQNLLNHEQIFYRFGFLNLAEILHLLNFSLSIFFFYVSKNSKTA